LLRFARSADSRDFTGCRFREKTSFVPWFKLRSPSFCPPTACASLLLTRLLGLLPTTLRTHRWRFRLVFCGSTPPRVFAHCGRALSRRVHALLSRWFLRGSVTMVFFFSVTWLVLLLRFFKRWFARRWFAYRALISACQRSVQRLIFSAFLRLDSFKLPRFARVVLRCWHDSRTPFRLHAHQLVLYPAALLTVLRSRSVARITAFSRCLSRSGSALLQFFLVPGISRSVLAFYAAHGCRNALSSRSHAPAILPPR